MKTKEIVVNRKAYHNYQIVDTLEAGLVLRGTEIKSLRNGRASFNDAYISLIKGQAYLKGLNISLYEYGNRNNHDEERERKLLLHKVEIRKLNSKVKLNGYTIIPLKIYLKRGLAKMEIALAKGKQLFDKRLDAKIKTMNREANKALKY